MKNWTAKDEEMLSEVLRSIDAVESEWGCDLQEEIDWLNGIKERLNKTN